LSYTLALAPTAPAWRGGQRLLLKIDGEVVADVDYRPTIDVSRPVVPPIEALPAIRAAGKRCDSCGFAHALALCMAVESLAGLAPGERAGRLRVAAAELERVAAHLDALGALFDALGLTADAAGLAGLGGEARALLAALAGPAPAEMLLPGGLSRDLGDDAQSALRQGLARLNRRLYQLADHMIDGRLLLARTVEVGAIGRDAALQFGLRGPLARAAGIAADLRLDAPYAAYAELPPAAVTQEGGDVYARLVVLLLEALESVKLVDRALVDLPAGDWRGSDAPELRPGEGQGEVEAPRGGLIYRVGSDGRRLTSVLAVPAPQIDRLLARALLGRARLDDAALITLSTAPCDGCATGDGL
jgi:Ni,Fe-hydrogenase III large subunit